MATASVIWVEVTIFLKVNQGTGYERKKMPLGRVGKPRNRLVEEEKHFFGYDGALVFAIFGKDEILPSNLQNTSERAHP